MVGGELVRENPTVRAELATNESMNIFRHLIRKGDWGGGNAEISPGKCRPSKYPPLQGPHGHSFPHPKTPVEFPREVPCLAGGTRQRAVEHRISPGATLDDNRKARDTRRFLSHRRDVLSVRRETRSDMQTYVGGETCFTVH